MEVLPLSENLINELITSLTKQWLNDFFKQKNTITGEEIVSFAPHKQINHFILLQIYQEWNAFQSKLHHQYFDFKHDEVKKAMIEFHNVLSQHIRVEKGEFRGMVEKAVYNNLRLIVNPVESFCNFFFQNKDSIPISLFERYSSYFIDFDFIISSILSYHKKNALQIVEKKVFIEKVERVVQLYEEKQTQSFVVYQKSIFAQLTGCFWEDYLTNAEQKSTAKNQDIILPPAIKQTINSPKDKLITQFGQIDYTDQQPVISNPKQQDELSAAEVNKKHNILNSFIQTDDTSKTKLVDHYKQSQQPNKINVGKKTLSIEHIPLYKRFQFSQKMFHGDSEALKNCVDDLNDCETQSDVEYVLNKKYLQPNNLTLEDELVAEFFKLFKQRFEN